MKPARLLLAEDEPSLRETLAAHLIELGYDVLATESATAALNRIADFDPDLVLSDVQMPGISGFELLSHLRETRPQTDVIISRGFWIGKHEVTQVEYLDVMGSNPSWFNGIREHRQEPGASACGSSPAADQWRDNNRNSTCRH